MKNDGVAARHFEVIGSASTQFFEPHHPLASFGLGGNFLPLKFDRDLFTVIGPTPNRDHRIALQHHIVGEETMKFHVCPRGCDEGKGGAGPDETGKKTWHHS
jgi:hypothetical protein